MSETLHLSHEFGPIYDKNSRVLILGSFPSVKSREMAFYYGHPQNRFWRIIRCLDNPALVGRSEQQPEARHSTMSAENIQTSSSEKPITSVKTSVNTPHWSCALPDLSNTPGIDEFFRHDPEAVKLLQQFTQNRPMAEHNAHHSQNTRHNTQNHFESTPDADGCDSYDNFVKVRLALILRNHLALWDTIESCTVTGSSDSSITDVTANDMSQVLAHAPIWLICCNGATSYRLFMKYAMKPMEAWCQQHAIRVPEVIQLPSTSPANAAWSLEGLLQSWKIIMD